MAATTKDAMTVLEIKVEQMFYQMVNESGSDVVRFSYISPAI